MKLTVEEPESGQLPVTIEQDGESDTHDLFPFEAIVTIQRTIVNMLENAEQEQQSKDS